MSPAAPHDTYCGRFAPSPTGPLHAGSLVSALASYLDARAHHGRWLVRIEDLDAPRSVPAAADQILHTLDRCGMRPDAPPQWQSQRIPLYETALARLTAAGLTYPCGCTRREIADSLSAAHLPNRAYVYSGTCRAGLRGKPARAWRVRVPDGDAASIDFTDRWQGACTQNLASEVGDFIVKRADDQWAYQLAVVVDDAQMQVTDVVRGADLLESTARQIYLQRCLGLPAPRYMHVPVLTDASGVKLSKQNGAAPIDDNRPLDALLGAARHLGMDVHAASLPAFYRAALAQWTGRFASPSV